MGQANFGVLVWGPLGQLLPEDVGSEQGKICTGDELPRERKLRRATTMPLTSTQRSCKSAQPQHGCTLPTLGSSGEREGNAASRELGGEATQRFRAGLAGRAVSGEPSSGPTLAHCIPPSPHPLLRATSKWEGRQPRDDPLPAPDPRGCLPGSRGPLGSFAFSPLRLCRALAVSGRQEGSVPQGSALLRGQHASSRSLCSGRGGGGSGGHAWWQLTGEHWGCGPWLPREEAGPCTTKSSRDGLTLASMCDSGSLRTYLRLTMGSSVVRDVIFSLIIIYSLIVSLMEMPHPNGLNH